MIIITLIDLCLLVIGCQIIKKHFQQLPDTLIPLVCVLLSTVVSLILVKFIIFEDKYLFLLHIGIINGLAAVGLNQLYRQTRRYILVKRAQKKLAKLRNKK